MRERDPRRAIDVPIEDSSLACGGTCSVQKRNPEAKAQIRQVSPPANVVWPFSGRVRAVPFKRSGRVSTPTHPHRQAQSRAEQQAQVELQARVAELEEALREKRLEAADLAAQLAQVLCRGEQDAERRRQAAEAAQGELEKERGTRNCATRKRARDADKGAKDLQDAHRELGKLQAEVDTLRAEGASSTKRVRELEEENFSLKVLRSTLAVELDAAKEAAAKAQSNTDRLLDLLAKGRDAS